MVRTVQNSFPYLIGTAFCIAVLGLVGTLQHLQSLMGTKLSIEDMTHHFLPTLTKSKRISEQEVFQRMLRESITSLEDCQQRDTKNHHHYPQQEDWMATRSKRITRFGFMNALTNHLAIPTTVTSAKQCVYPPSTSCHISSYTIVATSTGEELRSLLLNCMSWLTYPGVAHLKVVLPKRSKDILEQDVKYGHRLLTWDMDSGHKVQLVWVDTLWDALVNLTLLSDAIVFMDANVEWHGNARGIEAGFELWKRHSNNIIASSGWHLEIAGRRRLDDATGSSNDTSHEIRPVCKEERVTSALQADVELMALSGVYMHSSLLCFVSHTVLRPYRQFTTSLQEERVALSILVSQLSGHSLKLFPATVRGPGEEKRPRYEQLRSTESIVLETTGLNLQREIVVLSDTSMNLDAPLTEQSNWKQHLVPPATITEHPITPNSTIVVSTLTTESISDADSSKIPNTSIPLAKDSNTNKTTSTKISSSNVAATLTSVSNNNSALDLGSSVTSNTVALDLRSKNELTDGTASLLIDSPISAKTKSSVGVPFAEELRITSLRMKNLTERGVDQVTHPKSTTSVISPKATPALVKNFEATVETSWEHGASSSTKNGGMITTKSDKATPTRWATAIVSMNTKRPSYTKVSKRAIGNSTSKATTVYPEHGISSISSSSTSIIVPIEETPAHGSTSSSFRAKRLTKAVSRQATQLKATAAVVSPRSDESSVPTFSAKITKVATQRKESVSSNVKEATKESAEAVKQKSKVTKERHFVKEKVISVASTATTKKEKTMSSKLSTKELHVAHHKDTSELRIPHHSSVATLKTLGVKHELIATASKPRRLMQEWSMRSLDDNFAIIGYFGSMPVESISWCRSGCSILDEALDSEVSWIETACGAIE
jgi:hypothetical protein